MAAYLIGDIVRFHVGAPSSSSSKQTKSCGGRPQIGTWSAVFSALDELGEAPLSFWRDLLKKWLLDAVVVEVRMIPDPKLAEANTR